MESRNYYAQSIFYHICVPSFFDSDRDGIGDLKGITAKMSYLHSLGTDAIVLSPIFETDRDALHYGVTDYYRINPLFGTEEDFLSLLDAAHAQGLRVLLSIPVSCTSSAHQWFEKSSDRSPSNPYKEYYCRSDGRIGKASAPPSKEKDASGELAWSRSVAGEDWYRTIFGKDYPALNYDNPRLRKEMTDVFLYWKGKGVDGFYLDDPEFAIRRLTLPDGKPLYTVSDELFTVGGKLHRFLRDLREALGDTPVVLTSEGIDPAVFVYLVGEEKPVADAAVTEYFFAANRLDAPSRFSKKKFLASYLKAQNAYCKNISVAFGDRKHSRFLSAYEKEERYHVPCAKFLATLLLTSIGTPDIYQGDEIGMSDLRDVKKSTANRELTRADLAILGNARSPFQWDNKANADFTHDAFPYIPVHDDYRKVNAVAEANDPQSVLSFYRRMIAFRKASSALTIGSFTDHSKGKVLCYVRASDTERLLVIANTKNTPMNFTVPTDFLEADASCELCNYPLVSKPIHRTMGLRPYEIRIFRLTPPLPAIE